MNFGNKNKPKLNEKNANQTKEKPLSRHVELEH